MNCPFLVLFLLQIMIVNGDESQMMCNLEGNVPDCACDFKSVNGAVTNFLSPLLADLTSRTFFRYFRVNLDRPCPFWQEDGQCHLEKCSVCGCSEEEIPKKWIESTDHPESYVSSGFGWISTENSFKNGNLGLESLVFTNTSSRKAPVLTSTPASKEVKNDETTWIDMWEREEAETTGVNEGGMFVNLLENPERFTGYSGFSARRVWTSILEENCFGGLEEECTEKRVFFRVMSGLQASISTLLSREYFFPDKTWGENVPLFTRAVGSHPDRLGNLYFAFLFMLRAVVKSGDFLNQYSFDTGNTADDRAVQRLVQQLVGIRLPASMDMGAGAVSFPSFDSSSSSIGISSSYQDAMTGLLPTSANTQVSSQCGEAVLSAVEQCRNGFDESNLFQVVDRSNKGATYWQQVEDKQVLMEQFRSRFKNISRIMDCVSCEKCRVWGKLQIMGFGTAIKVLLTPEQELSSKSDALSRQEIIAMVNTLHQLTKSVKFANTVAERMRTQGSVDKSSSEAEAVMADSPSHSEGASPIASV